MAGKPKSAVVVPLFQRRVFEETPEISMGLPPVAAAAAEDAQPLSHIDLAGLAKAWLLIGAGGTGKTLLARWLAWRLEAEGRKALLVALDPQNRSLATWFSGVAQPETNDAAQTTRYLRELLNHLATEKLSSILDFGGGDTALARLIEVAPTFGDNLAASGIEPVACYAVGPRVDDLASLETFEAREFRPRATLVVLNEGRADSTLSREEAFARVNRHSALRSALTRGAVAVTMPRLEPEVAQEIEAKRLTFGQARDGLVPEGARFAPIGGIERAMVGRWLARMEEAFGPVRSWLP